MIYFLAPFRGMFKEKYSIQGTIQLFILLLLFIRWFRFPNGVWEIEGLIRLEFE